MNDMTADMISVGSSGAAEVHPSNRLSGKMGGMALTLTVLAFSAPIAVVEGFIPFAILFGGPGAVFAFLLTTLVLVLFATGYVTMARHVPKPGDFYAFVTSGLGRIAGLGAAFLAIFGYLCILGGTYVFLGVSLSSLVQSVGGPPVPWIVWTLLGWALVSTLGYFHIELSAKILTWAMVVEVVIVVIFDVCVLAKGGAQGLSIHPLTASAFSQGNVAMTMLYTILVFMGFEATALFRDEVRDPDRTIPRATYGAVLFIGLLYTVSSYALVAAYGDTAWAAAKANPTEMFARAIGHFVVPVFTQITYASVVISITAALISIHNVLSRYVLNLSIDRALPRYFGKVHARHNSPHLASMAVATLVLLALIPAAMSGISGGILYGLVTGIGGIVVIGLMGLVSLAVIAWFARNGVPASENVLKVYVAPGIAACVMFFSMTVALTHLDVVVGGRPGEDYMIVVLLFAVFLFGAGLATYFRAHKPDIYEGLGRAERIFEFLAEKKALGGQP